MCPMTHDMSELFSTVGPGVPISLKIRKISPVDQTINDKGVIWQYFFVVLY